MENMRKKIRKISQEFWYLIILIKVLFKRLETKQKEQRLLQLTFSEHKALSPQTAPTPHNSLGKIAEARQGMQDDEHLCYSSYKGLV